MCGYSKDTQCNTRESPQGFSLLEGSEMCLSVLTKARDVTVDLPVNNNQKQTHKNLIVKCDIASLTRQSLIDVIYFLN